MAQKIKIDLDPQGPITFKRTVAIPTPDGKPLKIEFDFKYRDREEMAAMTERYMEKAREELPSLLAEQKEQKDAAAAAEATGYVYIPPMPKLVDGVDEAIRNDVETVMDCASGWNVDAPFDAETLTKFFRRYAKAAVTIASDYRVSMTEGRLGN